MRFQISNSKFYARSFKEAREQRQYIINVQEKFDPFYVIDNFHCSCLLLKSCGKMSINERRLTESYKNILGDFWLTASAVRIYSFANVSKI